MTSPSTKPAAKVLSSQIGLIVDALNDCEKMGLEVIAFITETVPSPGGEGHICRCRQQSREAIP